MFWFVFIQGKRQENRRNAWPRYLKLVLHITLDGNIALTNVSGLGAMTIEARRVDKIEP